MLSGPDHDGCRYRADNPESVKDERLAIDGDAAPQLAVAVRGLMVKRAIFFAPLLFIWASAVLMAAGNWSATEDG